MHYANMPNIIAYEIYCNFFSDSSFSNDEMSIISYFCSKHRLWAHINRTASVTQLGVSNEYPQSMFKSKQYLKKKCIPL